MWLRRSDRAGHETDRGGRALGAQRDAMFGDRPGTAQAREASRVRATQILPHVLHPTVTLNWTQA